MVLFAQIFNGFVDLARSSFNVIAPGRLSMAANGIHDLLRSLRCARLLTDTCTAFAHLHTAPFHSDTRTGSPFALGHPGAALPPRKETCFLCNRSRAVTADGLASRVVMSIRCLGITLYPLRPNLPFLLTYLNRHTRTHTHSHTRYQLVPSSN